MRRAWLCPFGCGRTGERYEPGGSTTGPSDGREPTMGNRSISRSRVLMMVATGLMVAALVGCTGRGGGHLAPAAPVFTGEASFGFQLQL